VGRGNGGGATGIGRGAWVITVGGGRIGGGAAGVSPSNKRRSSSSQLTGPDCGRGVEEGRGWLEGLRGRRVRESSSSFGWPSFLNQVATAAMTIMTMVVINESMRRNYFLGVVVAVPLLPPPPPMLSRMPVSAWMLRMR